MKNGQFVSMALLAAGLMLVHRTTNAQVVTTLAGSGARDLMSEAGVSGDTSGNLSVADGGDEVTLPDGFWNGHECLRDLSVEAAQDAIAKRGERHDAVTAPGS